MQNTKQKNPQTNAAPGFLTEPLAPGAPFNAVTAQPDDLHQENNVPSMTDVPASPNPRKRRLGAGIAALLLVGGGVAVAPRLFRGQNGAPTASVAAAAPAVQTVAEGEAGVAGDLVVTQEAMELAEIKVAPVEKRVVRENLIVTGVIEASGDRLAKITPRVGGKVTRVGAVVGDVVRAGQTLAFIASGELAQAQAAYRQSAARIAAAQSAVTRQRQLARLGAFGSPAVEDARTRSLEAEEHIHEAEHEIEVKTAELSEARSAREALGTQVAQAEAQADVVKTRADRTDALFKEQLVSRQENEQAQAEVKKAQSDVLVARAEAAQGAARLQSVSSQLGAAKVHYQLALKRARITTEAQARQEKVYRGGFLASKELAEAETALRQARLDQQATIQSVRLLGGAPGGGSTVAVTSPITGRVQERKVSLGETVDTDHDLFIVVNLDQVIAELQVAPRDLRHVRPGQRVELTADATGGKIFAGRVVSLGTTASEATRAVSVRVAFDNRNGTLRPGAFVRGGVVTDVRQERVTVPDGAIQEHTGKKTVYVARSGKPGAFQVRHVLLGEPLNGSREIKDGLNGTETIAVNGTFYLKSEALKDSLSDGCCAIDVKE